MSMQTINYCKYFWAGVCTSPSVELPSSASEVGGIRFCDDLGQGNGGRIACDKASVSTKAVLRRSQASALQIGLSEVHDGDGLL